jgi:hypothetical protein
MEDRYVMLEFQYKAQSTYYNDVFSAALKVVARLAYKGAKTYG